VLKKSQLRKIILEILNESSPDDSIRWNNISNNAKYQLRVSFTEWINVLKKTYSPQLASKYVYLMGKSINNLNKENPDESARPLAYLPLEMRLSLSRFIEGVNNEETEEAFFFLLGLSRNFVEPIRINQPDIELKGITNVISPRGVYRGNVTIAGLQDMRPTINFGFGPYELTDDWYKIYNKPHSELYLDVGQEIKITNISEVLIKIKNAIDNWQS
jgi:hypothetical protein